jgi:lipopolysaccharide/colanic/teichoic acid biosynthesis glycosyltransferase
MNVIDLPEPAPVKRVPIKRTLVVPPPSQEPSPLKNMIMTEAGKGVAKFITEQVDLRKKGVLLVTATGQHSSPGTELHSVRSFIDLQLINGQTKELDHFFQSIYSRLPDAGIYIGCVESNSIRKERVYRRYPRRLARMIWHFDFVFNRVIPKLGGTRGLYRFFLPGRKHFLSKAEALGRLSYAGFEIIGHELIHHRFYFSVIKVNKVANARKPSTGLFFQMPRISKGGKSIGIYKIRTMHPYSEFLQNYVVKMNGYNEIGKPNRDFRLTSWGKIIRKLHLDEVPQFYNLIKGDLNLVGVRPISKFGYESLPTDLQQERIKYKPGCIPPNVSLGITGFNGVIKAERIYLNELKKYGYIINIKYFFMAVYRIVLRKNESA